MSKAAAITAAFGSTGAWATARFAAAMSAGRMFTPADLRTLEILRNEEWIYYDNAVIDGARLRLRGVADLMAAGLVRNIPNGLAKTILEYGKVGDMDAAIVSLDGVTRSENDNIEYEFANLPLPITHKDFYLNLRTLLASRTGGEPLDTTYANVAGRKVGEETERMLFRGGKTFLGSTIYGYTTHPHRLTAGFATNGQWGAAAKTGENITEDIGVAMAALEAQGFYGPVWIYIGAGMSGKMAQDYKAAGTVSIRTRILEDERVARISVVDQMPASAVVFVQPTPDVVQMAIGEELQTVQWDVHGGFQINFKAFQIAVPLIRSNVNDKTGVLHMS
jgi:uncharacterized linocin/CFP29 family protein